jgi:NAD(P)-dependent dehydrogenase (short-subunit alcohol dehydrogenase family)
MGSEKTVLITGATDGVGKVVARRFASAGAKVLLHGRDREKGAAVLAELRRETANPHLEYFCADLSSLSEVRHLAEALSSQHKRIDVLINNAGIGGGRHGQLLASSGAVEREQSEHSAPAGLERTIEGHELRFVVNYLSAFLLTHLLLRELQSGSAPRVVAVSSLGQSPINFADVMLTGGQDAMHAYRQSKLAQVMFSFELAERQREGGLTAVAVHPASFMNTRMVAESGITPKSTVEEGAAAIVHAATAGELLGKPQLFLNGHVPARANDQAYDRQARARLWDLSTRLAGLPA